ncbi:MAG: ribokinase [Gammaproteobacteria bacterium]|nr:ribokinase [Gammaproteobacteria bacterium]
MPKLVNLGSLCVDNVYHVQSIARAGETVTSLGHEVHPGGKGLNQSLAAARAGAEVVHVGCVGSDGGSLVDVLSGSGVDVSYIRTLESPSGSAVIQVDAHGQNAIFITGGANRLVSRDQVDTAIELLDSDDWLLLQNEINDLDYVLDAAEAHGANTAFNVAPVDGRESEYSYSAVSMLILNEIEAGALAQTDDHLQAFTTLRSSYPATQIILTLGREGLRYALGNKTLELPAFDVEVIDETAAGDAFIGFYMAAVLRAESTYVSLREASAAGALAVTKTGAATSIPYRTAVESFIANY